MTVLAPIDWAKVGQAVREARRREGESLRAFARRLHVDFRVVHSLEHGEPVKTDNYLQVCASFRVDPFEFGGVKKGQQ